MSAQLQNSTHNYSGSDVYYQYSMIILCALLFFALLAVPHSAQGVVTGDIVASAPLNDVTIVIQNREWGDVAMDPVSNVAAVWIGNYTGAKYSLTGSKLFPDIDARLPAFSISQSDVDPTSRPNVKAGGANRIVAAWASDDAGGKQIYFRCFDVDLSPVPLIDQSQANASLTGSHSSPFIALNADNSFTLLWTYAPVSGGFHTSIYAREYTADCNPVASPYEVYATSGTASISDMVADGDTAGDSVITWREDNGAGAWEVKAQRLGAPALPAFTVASGATITTDTVVSVANTQLADGNFVVTWVSQQDLTRELKTRRFNADGTAIDVNPVTLHSNPYIKFIDTSMDMFGRFGLVFSEELLYETPFTKTAYLRQYDAQLIPLYDLLTLINNNYYFWSLVIASDADGDLLSAWTDSTGVRLSGKRNAGPEPVDVSVVVENKTGRTDMERLELTVTVTNNQPVNTDGGIGEGVGASSGIQVQVTPPTGSTQVGTWPGNWTCDAATLCTLNKPLLAGTTEQFNIVFDNAPLGTASTTVSLTSRQVDPVMINNQATVETQLCNDYGVIEFDVLDPNLTTSETIGQFTTSVKRSGGTCGPVSAHVTTIPQPLLPWLYSGVAGEDYTDIDELLSWANGESDIKTVNIPIINDEVDDGDKQFEVRISEIVSAKLGGNSRVLVVIEDDEASVLADPDSTGGTTTSSTGSSGGGALGFGVFLMFMLSWLIRKRG